MKKKRRKKQYRRYAPVKMKFFEVENPLPGIPAETRQAMVRQAAANARSTFEAEYPKLADWFDEYDPLHVLSFCAFYFLTSPQGVDKEAIEGKLDFGSHHLELIQAMALMRPRAGGPRPLGSNALYFTKN